ncbi:MULTISPECIES: hypothetical protein [unclassified Streptomyces]
MAEWIKAQVGQLSSSGCDLEPEWIEDIAGAIIELGGETGPLAVWRTKEGWLTQSELIDWISRRDCVYVVHPVYAHARVGMQDILVDLVDDAVYFEVGRRMALSGHAGDWPLPEAKFHSAGIPGAFGDAVRAAWNLSEVVDLEPAWDREEGNRKVSSYQGEDIQGDVAVFRRSDFM